MQRPCWCSSLTTTRRTGNITPGKKMKRLQPKALIIVFHYPSIIQLNVLAITFV
jgi:hypothetical protein